MPSPFPGMNPYLEQRTVFHSFHQTVVPVIGELIIADLPAAFYASVEVELYIHELPADQRRLVGKGDVGVREGAADPSRTSGTAAATAAPAAPAYGSFPLSVDELRLTYLEIRDLKDDRVVTVIEVLSPSNKYAGPDRDKYLQKRHAVVRSEANLVEIDLLRGGPRLPLDGMIACDYCVLTARVAERPKVGIWPIELRDRLPRIPIPLRDGHADVWVDLQKAIDLAYDRGGYARYIYRNEPEPALRPDDAEWAKPFVPEALRR